MSTELHWSQHSLACRDLTIRYDRAPVLRCVDLTVAPDEMLAVLGPSGSGKSTLLHAVAGFVPPSAGEIWLSGRKVATPQQALPPEKRDVGMVFQNYALWPHLSVLDTVAYPARRAGTRRSAARRQAAELLERLGLADLADRRPARLSGGQQQRVGLARALARNASLYLFDEPTAHLDTHLRARFQAELLARRRASGAAAVYATHDAAEALSLADRVALVDDGRIVQIDTPAQVYAEPVSLWAARLTGPAALLRAPVSREGPDTLHVELQGRGVDVRGGGALPSSTRAAAAAMVVRPDWTYVGGPCVGHLENVWFHGPHTDYLVATPEGAVLVRQPGPPEHEPGTQLSWGIRRAWVLADDAPGASELSGERLDGSGATGSVVDELLVGDREVPFGEVAQPPKLP